MRTLIFLQLALIHGAIAIPQFNDGSGSSGSPSQTSGSEPTQTTSGDQSSQTSGSEVSQSLSSGSGFNANNFWSAVDSNCDGFLPDLDQCLKIEDKGRAKRMDAATHFYECAASVFHSTFGTCISPRLGITWTVRPPLNLQSNETCKYANVYKSVIPACKSYSDQIEKSSCCNSGGTASCDSVVDPFLTCQAFAIREYVHCSQWYKSDKANSQDQVTDCVTRNVNNLRWPADFIVAQSGDKCQSAKKVEGFLILSNIESIIMAVIGVYLLMPLKDKLMPSFLKSKEEPDENMVKISMLSMLWTFGSEFATAFLVMYVMQQEGFTNFDAGNTEALFLLRPRATALVAFTGLFVPKIRTAGVSEIVVDCGFGICSIYYCAISIMDRFRNNVGDYGDRRFIVDSHVPNPGYGFYILGLMFMVTSALIELVVLSYLAFKKGMLKKCIMNLCKFGGFEESFDDVKKYYYILLGASLGIYLGCWMVWGVIVGYAGQLWCPASWKDTITILTVYPVVLNAIRSWMTS